MEEKTNFDLSLVNSYISFLRGRGIEYIPFPLSENDLKNISTPLLSWIYYNRNSNLLELPRMLDFDSRRRKQIVGPSIVEGGEVKNYQKGEGTCKEAIAIIEQIWPEMYGFINAVNPIISHIDPHGKIESESNPRIFGEIYYNMLSDCPIKWGEIISHEMAHHYIFIVLAAKKEQEIFKRPFKDIRFSALRDEQRPLIGVYHALFAQTCMIIFASSVVSSNLEQTYRDKSLIIIERYREIFPQDFKTVVESELINFDDKVKDFILEANHYINRLV